MVLLFEDVRDGEGDGVAVETPPASLAELRLVSGVERLVELFVMLGSTGKSRQNVSF